METLIVWTIVSIALVLVIRSVYRTFKGKSTCCGCSDYTCPSRVED